MKWYICIMSEAHILKEILLACSRGSSRLFRIASSAAWVGKYVGKRGNITMIENARIVHPAPEGFSDCVGWKRITITPDMIGKTIAQFVVIEAKSPRGRASQKQIAFLSAVKSSGGIAIVARSADEAMIQLQK